MVCLETQARRAMSSIEAVTPRSANPSMAASRIASFLETSIWPAMRGMSVASALRGPRHRRTGPREEGEADGDPAGQGQHREGVAEAEHRRLAVEHGAHRLAGRAFGVGHAALGHHGGEA